jgi:hypothetical protein
MQSQPAYRNFDPMCGYWDMTPVLNEQAATFPSRQPASADHHPSWVTVD